MTLSPAAFKLAVVAVLLLNKQCKTSPIPSPPDRSEDDAWSLEHAVSSWIQPHVQQSPRNNWTADGLSSGPANRQHSPAVSEDCNAFMHECSSHADINTFHSMPPHIPLLTQSMTLSHSQLPAHGRPSITEPLPYHSGSVMPTKPSDPSQHPGSSALLTKEWMDDHRAQLMQMYAVFSERTGASPQLAAQRFREKGTAQILEAILSNDVARQEAAIDMLGRPKYRHKDGRRQHLLGSEADALTKKLADFHRITPRQAGQILNRRLKETEAYLLKNPDTFAVGAMMMRPKAPFGQRKALSPQMKAFMQQHQQVIQRAQRAAAAASTSHGVVDGEVSSSSGSRRNRISTQERRQRNRTERPYRKRPKYGASGLAHLDRADDVVPAWTISKMSTTYMRAISCHRATAQRYVRQAIIARPGEASELAKDLLSADATKIRIAIDKIGFPQSKRVGSASRQEL